MKDNLFEILMNLFETSFAQLQKNQKAIEEQLEKRLSPITSLDLPTQTTEVEANHFKSPKPSSIRVFTYAEQMKLTKASYQFLKRMQLWGVIDADVLELVMNQLIFSDSHVVTLQETKWAIRNVMSNFLSDDEMTFLDIILYQTEDELTAH